MDLDERGIPITGPDEAYSKGCPPKPCALCFGVSAIMKDKKFLTSWEWCQLMKTCAATCDWERIFAR